MFRSLSASETRTFEERVPFLVESVLPRTNALFTMVGVGTGWGWPWPSYSHAERQVGVGSEGRTGGATWSRIACTRSYGTNNRMPPHGHEVKGYALPPAGAGSVWKQQCQQPANGRIHTTEDVPENWSCTDGSIIITPPPPSHLSRNRVAPRQK